MLSFASRILARNLNLVVGAGFLFALLLGIFSTVSGMIHDEPVHSAEHEFHLKPRELSLVEQAVKAADQRSAELAEQLGQ